MDLFHEIHNRNLLEECPVGIDSHDWETFRSDYEKAGQFERLEYPVQLDVELNGGCNMKCPFCLHDASRGFRAMYRLCQIRWDIERLYGYQRDVVKSQASGLNLELWYHQDIHIVRCDNV